MNETLRARTDVPQDAVAHTRMSVNVNEEEKPRRNPSSRPSSAAYSEANAASNAAVGGVIAFSFLM
ncbi:hypothetical protein ACFXJ8_36475 [Nonomuraea sp. NPDC059194]|uniref:hypothetical protein n=1 Tax=Nonomuraea sp. NPDC059194 TaxID=3346764 RepID=UPI003690A2E7